MAGESLGTARLDLQVDTTGFEAAIARSKNVAAGLGTAAEQAFTKADSAAKRSATGLIRWSELIGKSADEQKFLNAAMRGVPTEILDAVRKKYEDVQRTIAATANTARDLAAAEAQSAAFSSAAKTAAENDMLREQQRVVAALTAQFHALEAAEQQEAQFALAAKTAAENDFMREQQRVVAALTAQFHALEQAEAQAAAGNQFVASLQQQAAAIGKTRAELLEMKAAEMGVAAQAAPFIAQLKAQETQLLRSGIAFDKYGLSAKQTAAALRQVPAQMTDIFISLQGGQNPLTVLLQQGGQLKDVFGGVVPAARALGAAILGLINPYTVAAAAALGLLAVLNDTEKQSKALSNALILAGRDAGGAADELRGMASELAAVTHASERSALALVSQAAATGRFTTEQIQMVSAAAQAMEEATGRAAKTTIEEFARIGEGPVDAILRLNGAIGDGTNVTNFLTAETLKQIRALQEQGDTAGATQLAITAYFDAINDRAPNAAANLTNIQRAWKSIVEVGGEIADQATKRVNELLGAMEQVYNFNTKFANLVSGNGFRLPGEGGEKPRVRTTTARGTAPKVVDTAEEQRRLRAEQEYNSLVQGNLSETKRQEAEIARIRQAGRIAGVKTAEIERQVAESNKRFAESQAKRGGRGGARSLANAESRADLQEFKDALREEQALIEQGSRILQAEYSARLVDANTYYTGLREAAEKNAAAEERALVGQLEALRSRSVSGKDSIDTQRKIGELEAQLAALRTESATKLKVLTIQEQAFYQGRANAIEQFKFALEENNIALEDQIAAEVRSIGIGREQAQQEQALNDIYAEQAARLRELALQLKQKEIDQAEYDSRVSGLQDATDRRVAIVQAGFDSMADAQGNWLNGLNAGIADWIKGTEDVASQISAITERSLDRAADALAEFALTGKLNIRDMLADILSELVKFFAKRAVMQFLKAFLGGGTGIGDISLSGGANANGNVFGPQGIVPFAKGGVVSGPTLFPFAKGTGLMGEAGPEAIMPLKRGSDGKLGVVAQGGGAGGVVVNLTTNVAVDGSASTTTTTSAERDAGVREFSAQMAAVAQREIDRAMRPGGSLYRVGMART